MGWGFFFFFGGGGGKMFKYVEKSKCRELVAWVDLGLQNIILGFV